MSSKSSHHAAVNMSAKRIVKLIKSYGLRIDGVGFQGHLASEKTSTSGGAAPAQSTLTDALRGVAAEGVYVAYTEVDVRLNTPITVDRLAVQARTYQRIVASCIAVPRYVGLTVWSKHLRY
ncbi:unnamed protein product [Alternaria alternata]